MRVFGGSASEGIALLCTRAHCSGNMIDYPIGSLPLHYELRAVHAILSHNVLGASMSNCRSFESKDSSPIAYSAYGSNGAGDRRFFSRLVAVTVSR